MASLHPINHYSIGACVYRNACINVMNNKYVVVTPTIAPYLSHLLVLIMTQNCVFESRSVDLRQNHTLCGAQSVD